MTLSYASAALTNNERIVWYVILGLGLVVVLVVIALMTLLLSFVADIRESVGGLLVAAGSIAAQTGNIPLLLQVPPVLDIIAEEGVVLDHYMDALSQGYETG
jgi:predicted permease